MYNHFAFLVCATLILCTSCTSTSTPSNTSSLSENLNITSTQAPEVIALDTPVAVGVDPISLTLSKASESLASYTKTSPLKSSILWRFASEEKTTTIDGTSIQFAGVLDSDVKKLQNALLLQEYRPSESSQSYTSDQEFASGYEQYPSVCLIAQKATSTENPKTWSVTLSCGSLPNSISSSKEALTNIDQLFTDIQKKSQLRGYIIENHYFAWTENEQVGGIIKGKQLSLRKIPASNMFSVSEYFEQKKWNPSAHMMADGTVVGGMGYGSGTIRCQIILGMFDGYHDMLKLPEAEQEAFRKKIEQTLQAPDASQNESIESEMFINCGEWNN